jgi:hypothetical protein
MLSANSRSRLARPWSSVMSSGRQRSVSGNFSRTRTPPASAGSSDGGFAPSISKSGGIAVGIAMSSAIAPDRLRNDASRTLTEAHTTAIASPISPVTVPRTILPLVRSPQVNQRATYSAAPAIAPSHVHPAITFSSPAAFCVAAACTLVEYVSRCRVCGEPGASVTVTVSVIGRPSTIRIRVSCTGCGGGAIVRTVRAKRACSNSARSSPDGPSGDHG